MKKVIEQVKLERKEQHQPRVEMRLQQWLLSHTKISYTRSFKHPLAYKGGIG